MIVKEFAKPLSSADLNQELQKVYSWSLNLSEMTIDSANGILANMKGKVSSIKESAKGHFAEKNPSYMEALLVTKVLESFIDEKFAQQAQERKMTKAEMGKREKYVKGMKKVKGDFEKRYPGRGEEVMYATATKMAQKESVEEAMDILKSALAGQEPLLEGEYDQARAVMAARDMVDTVQDMVEKLSKMMNEDLPALIDVMRGELGAPQADAFSTAATGAIQPLLDQAKGARQSLDGAARAAAGDVTAAQPQPMGVEPMAAPMGPEEPVEPETDATADAATGGDLELGRGKR